MVSPNSAIGSKPRKMPFPSNDWFTAILVLQSESEEKKKVLLPQETPLIGGVTWATELKKSSFESHDFGLGRTESLLKFFGG